MKVSIIIPVYNVSTYLTSCLESCVNQTYKDVEIICVNDGSPDNSLSIIKKYQEADKRVVCISKQNEGLPLARKSGIKAATGDYIFHLDGDDDLPHNAIECMMKTAVAENADIVIGDYLWVEGKQRKVIDSEINEILDSRSYSKYLLERGLFNIWGKLIKRSLYTKNAIEFPAKIVMAEDLVACVQLARFAQIIVPIHKICCNHYVRTESMSRTNKYVVGELTDRTIHAVCFVSRYYEQISLGNELKSSIDHLLTTFLYQYLCSPYPISYHRESLQYIRSRISPEYIKNISNTVKRTSIQMAMKNLELSKLMMRCIMLLLKLKK